MLFRSEFDEDYNDLHKWCNFKWVKNGNKGKVSPVLITKYVEVYPADWKGKWEEYPRLRLHFKYGRLLDYDNVTGQ